MKSIRWTLLRNYKNQSKFHQNHAGLCKEMSLTSFDKLISAGDSQDNPQTSNASPEMNTRVCPCGVFKVSRYSSQEAYWMGASRYFDVKSKGFDDCENTFPVVNSIIVCCVESYLESHLMTLIQ